MDAKVFMATRKWLPKCMRNFHEQKTIFKWIGESASRARTPLCQIPNWVDAHVYVIDFFLFIMAQHGWTLQRSRVKCDFADIEKSLKDFDELELQRLKASIDASMNKASATN